jgi:hypothetical protein
MSGSNITEDRAQVMLTQQALQTQAVLQAQQVQLKMVVAVCACLLQDKSPQSELAQALDFLMSERHAEFHTKATTTRERLEVMPVWRDCQHTVCVAAKRLLDQFTKPEIIISPLMAQRAATKRVMFEQTPIGLKAFLADKAVEQPRIIL